MTTIATVIADLQTALVDAEAVAGSAPDPTPQPTTIPTIVQRPIDLSELVGLSAQIPVDRYDRFQNALVLTATAINLQFVKVNIQAGGVLTVLAYPDYRLLVNGTERAKAQINAAKNGGFFVGMLVDEIDDIAKFDIVAYDATGTFVAAPIETLMTLWGTINRNGGAASATHVVMQSQSFEWGHIGPSYDYVIVPKVNAVAVADPLVPLAPVPFSTALPSKQIVKIDLLPCSSENTNQTHYPVQMRSGVTVTDNFQSYFPSTMGYAQAAVPAIDGPRGVAMLSFPLVLRTGRQGKVYGCDIHSFFKVDGTGTRTTLLGKRHKVAPYWGDVTAAYDGTETVGNWDASIPAVECFPYESWGFDWDARTLAIDSSQPIPPGETEEPHIPIGPVAYIADRHGYVLKAQFNNLSHAVAPIVTRALPIPDPWGCRWDATKNVLYIADRSNHALTAWSPDAGTKTTVLANATGASLVTLPDPAQPENFIHLAPGITLAQARAVPILAPEGLDLLDGYLYFSSIAQQDVRRINLATGVVEICCRPTIDGNSYYLTFSISDGTFGPRGTIFATSFSSNYFGRPLAYLPTPGTASDGTALTHSVVWNYHAFEHGHTQGVTDSESEAYATACTVGHGIMACGSSQFGLSVFMQARATDVAVSAAQATAGETKYNARGYYLLWGAFGHGPTNYPLPWGVDPDIDYFLTVNGARAA